MQGITKRGLVVSKYGTIKKFAEAIGWTYRKANDIVNDRQQANATEIDQMAAALGIELPEAFAEIFLHRTPQNVDNKRGA